MNFRRLAFHWELPYKMLVVVKRRRLHCSSANSGLMNISILVCFEDIDGTFEHVHLVNVDNPGIDVRSSDVTNLGGRILTSEIPLELGVLRVGVGSDGVARKGNDDGGGAYFHCRDEMIGICLDGDEMNWFVRAREGSVGCLYCVSWVAFGWQTLTFDSLFFLAREKTDLLAQEAIISNI